jgi:hypothetical protein
MRVTELANRFKTTRKTIKKIIDDKGESTRQPRSDIVSLDEELVLKTLKECQGWGERTYEILTSKGMNISYSSFMKKVREITKKQTKKFSTPVQDVPGAESQHDTSPYIVEVGTTKLSVQASLIYYRFSKAVYLKFYPSFTRFHMKCFFHEALMHFGYTPKKCIIDNTHLAVLRGTGANALFVQEMDDFAKAYGFEWLAHELKHSDRKAGVERGFWTTVTNFFPGRTFSSIEDLNNQAKEWSLKRFNKPNKNKIIPAERFEQEIPYMKTVLKGIHPPYISHTRIIDQEGYVLLRTNLYWVGIRRGMEVTLLEYANKVVIYNNRKLITEYALPLFGIKQTKFRPTGVSVPYRPKKTTVPPFSEEKELRLLPFCNDYFDMSLKELGPQQRYKMIRQVYYLSKKLTQDLFEKTIMRALKYNIKDKNTLEKISIYLMNQESFILGDYMDSSETTDEHWSNSPDLNKYYKEEEDE